MSFSNDSRLTLPVGERDHVLGNASAKIVLVEYGDYECPHCVRAHRVISEIRREVGDRLRFVFRNFPLAQAHPHAQSAAEAAEAAGVQGKFWEMHDAIFERTEPLSYQYLLALGSGAGLDVEQIERDLAARTFEERVRQDFTSGVRSGVNGTPTFFVNERRYDGFADYDSLLDALESLDVGELR